MYPVASPHLSSLGTDNADLYAVQNASRVIHEQLLRDSQTAFNLTDALSTPSGHSSESYTVYPGDYCTPFQKKRHIGIPPALWEHFQSTKSTCHMGILPDIERVWISLDHKLFLWDYVEGHDLSSFVEQNDVICHVALVKPRTGVFIDAISSLLVICTSVSVLLIGVSSTMIINKEIRHQDIKLYATDMLVNTDGIQMTSVISTTDGRIFLCGDEDGNIYELHYQEKEVWFGKRFHLINHFINGVSSFLPMFSTPQSTERITSLVSDHSGEYFYSLSDQNWISMWRPEPNRRLRKVQTISNLYKQVQDRAPGAAAQIQPFRILSLHIVGHKDAKAATRIMALSSTGVRLYISVVHISQGYGMGATFGSPSIQLHLTHVRFPPASLYHPDERSQQSATSDYRHSENTSHKRSSPLILNNLSVAAYGGDVLVAAQASDVEGRDFLLGVAPDLMKLSTSGMLLSSRLQPSPAAVHPSPGLTSNITQVKPSLVEQAIVLYVEGTIWAIADIHPERQYQSAPNYSENYSASHELVTQFTEPRREFIIITNAGISFLVKRSVIDYLRDALEEFHAEGSIQSIINFRNSFGRDQTCAMLVALASGNTFVSHEESFSSNEEMTTSSDSDIASIIRQAFFDLGERPIWVEETFASGGVEGNIIYSGRRQGIAIYTARLFRPFWRAAVISFTPSNTLAMAKKNIHSLRTFLSKNIQLFNASPADHTIARSVDEQRAWKAEQESISSLMSLLIRAEEAISFVLLLNEYNISELVAQCNSDTQKLLSTLTYEELITTENGSIASSALVNAIINYQIVRQISVDAISDILQQRCGSFCSGDDVMLFKARENIRTAAKTNDPSERQKILAESQRLFTRAVRAIDFQKLREICGDYQQLHYVKGVVEIPLLCAHVMDTDKLGLDYWLAGCPDNDPRREFLNKRQQCYDLVLDSFPIFEQDQFLEQKLSSSLFTDADAHEYGHHIFDVAFNSDDPVFHSHLYDWFIDRGMISTLLEIRPTYLEAHLQREPHSISNYELLWQLYVRNGQFFRAAEILASLAQSTKFDVSLNTRIEYLTLAISYAKSHPFSIAEKHESAISFLSGLEDLLEVARIQLEVQTALAPRLSESDDLKRKFSLLQGGLFNITELFQLYAEPFDLSSIMLTILHVSEHRDDVMLQTIWNNIFKCVLNDGKPDNVANTLKSTIISYSRRFYPSQCAFPLKYISSQLMEFALVNKSTLPRGWTPRVLREGNIPYLAIWEVLHDMYDSQIPPFNIQTNVQVVSSDIAVLLQEWMLELQQPESAVARNTLPVDILDNAIAKYLEEIGETNKPSRDEFENARRQLRRYW